MYADILEQPRDIASEQLMQLHSHSQREPLKHGIQQKQHSLRSLREAKEEKLSIKALRW